MKYLKVTVTKINQRRNVWTNEYQYTTFSDLREMHEKTDEKHFYDSIIKLNLFSVKEIVSGKNIFVLENNSNELTLKKSLKQLQDLLNENIEVFICYRSELDRKEIATLENVKNYLKTFPTSLFARNIGYQINSNKELIKETNDKRKIKKLLKKFKNNR